ncbi:MAG: hypothetical protein MUC86_07080 [Burkholderiaceae bacterium]|jgi:aspartate/methionine/tyrosine aminotransferase|nr:hypothetical protein [Burkholderiaceae bacterium]
MEIVKAAGHIEVGCCSAIHISLGEFGFTVPPPVLEASARAMVMGDAAYTAARALSRS